MPKLSKIIHNYKIFNFFSKNFLVQYFQNGNNYYFKHTKCLLNTSSISNDVTLNKNKMVKQLKF